MGETMIAPPPPEETPADSFFSRAIGVFISPGRTFESIARRPDFLAPLIIMTVASIVVIEAMLQKIGVARILRRSIEMSKQGAQMSPEQIDQTIQKIAGFTSISMRAGGVLGVALFVLVIAAIGLFFVNVLFGGSASFSLLFGG